MRHLLRHVRALENLLPPDGGARGRGGQRDRQTEQRRADMLDDQAVRCLDLGKYTFVGVAAAVGAVMTAPLSTMAVAGTRRRGRCW